MKKKAIRRLIRRNGKPLVVFVDVDTGQEITNLDGYEIVSADSGNDSFLPPKSNSPQPSGGGYVEQTVTQGDSSSSSSQTDDAFMNRPGASRGTGNILADLAAAKTHFDAIKLDVKQSAINAGMELLGIPTTTSPVGGGSGQRSYSDVEKYKTGAGKDIPEETGQPIAQSDKIQYRDGINIRRLPVSEFFTEHMTAALQATDPSLTILIQSGGQPAKGKGPFTKDGETYTERTGSTRHDVNADGFSDTADFVLVRNGQAITPQRDPELYKELFRNAAAVGFTGLGYYPTFVHIGMGDVGYWGPDGKGSSMPPEFITAIEEGRAMAARGEGEKLLAGVAQPVAPVPATRTQINTTPAPAGFDEVGQGLIQSLSGIRTIMGLPPQPMAGTSTVDSIGGQPRFDDVQNFRNPASQKVNTQYVQPDGTVTTVPQAGQEAMPLDARPDMNQIWMQSGTLPPYTVPQQGGVEDFLRQEALGSPTAGDQATSGVPLPKNDPLASTGLQMNPTPVAGGMPMQLKPEERIKAAQTLIGEAGGEGVDGMVAVANVIRNRLASDMYPDDLIGVISQPGQFSAWNDLKHGGNNPSVWKPGDPTFEQAAQVVDSVFGGLLPDNTMGSVQYHNSAITPYWADEANTEGTLQIGNHMFYPKKNDAIGAIDQMLGTRPSPNPAPKIENAAPFAPRPKSIDTPSNVQTSSDRMTASVSNKQSMAPAGSKNISKTSTPKASSSPTTSSNFAPQSSYGSGENYHEAKVSSPKPSTTANNSVKNTTSSFMTTPVAPKPQVTTPSTPKTTNSTPSKSEDKNTTSQTRYISGR